MASLGLAALLRVLWLNAVESAARQILSDKLTERIEQQKREYGVNPYVTNE